jgi:hypothetical protein
MLTLVCCLGDFFEPSWSICNQPEECATSKKMQLRRETKIMLNRQEDYDIDAVRICILLDIDTLSRVLDNDAQQHSAQSGLVKRTISQYIRKRPRYPTG